MMQYGDIPDAELMVSITKVNKVKKDLEKAAKMREHIISKIRRTAEVGGSEVMIVAHNLSPLDPMYEMFVEHNTFKYVLEEFESKGYRTDVYTDGLIKHIDGSKDIPTSIFVSWDPERIKLRKGEDK
ncbi:hypothetical protein BCPG3_131 [Bacillus phage BCPG3]|nr:hypothetical protein BCPG1_130 [Bacillus phage BCPG1]QSJ04448.1 hypothetical protein BCPG3_131 [Bacillus phage BCPG3]QSJ04657.1 hypothetical protein BCP18_125 [Bacillus phage BCP18]